MSVKTAKRVFSLERTYRYIHTFIQTKEDFLAPTIQINITHRWLRMPTILFIKIKSLHVKSVLHFLQILDLISGNSNETNMVED